MSLLEEIKRRKNGLRHQTTMVTSACGEKYEENMTFDGKIEISSTGKRCLGFVVDEKPDLQVAEILPFLLLSSQDVALDVELLKGICVTHVLSVGIDIPFAFRLSRVKYKKIDLLDLPESDLTTVLDECFSFIDDARSENCSNKILVHCNAGYSRGPAVVIAYLMRSFGYDVETAHDFVNKKRKVRPNQGFLTQLKHYELKLVRERSKSEQQTYFPVT